MKHWQKLVVALLEISCFSVVSQVMVFPAEKNSSTTVPTLYLFNAFGTKQKNPRDEIINGPAKALKKYLADSQEKNYFKSVQQQEKKRPTINGPETVKIAFGAKLSLNDFASSSAKGKKLAVSLLNEFNNKKLGEQEIILQSRDQKNASERFKVVTAEVVDQKAPVLTLTKKALTTTQGKKIDVMSGVSATDLEMGNLTSRVTHTAIDFTRAGKQTIVYSVSDDAKHKTTLSAQLTVKQNASSSGSAAYAGTQNNFAENAVRSAGVATTGSSYLPNQIYFSSNHISYVNGGAALGQSLIDRNPYGLASTYYGSRFSGTDGQFSHFIGHFTGAFAPVLSMGAGASITVTDGAGTPFTYHVYKTVTLAMKPGGDGKVYPTTAEGKNIVADLYYNRLAGEQIVLQTCEVASGQLTKFVFAQK